MKIVMPIFGTRPEAVKMCPLIKELRSRGSLCTVVAVSGQHREMLRGVLEFFSVLPDFDLSVMQSGQTLFDLTERIMRGTERLLESVRPDLVLVHGDTTTAFAAALACYYKGTPVGHVEAGLRSGSIRSPFPEELNRRTVSAISELDFAPTEGARENLISEGKSGDRVFVTGNTVIDALRFTVRPDHTHPLLSKVHGSRVILLTAHRRESRGEPMQAVFRAVKRIVADFPDVSVIFPMHASPEVRREASLLDGVDRIHLIEPLGVIDFHNLMARCYMIVTDSGGIQEEAPALGKPVLVTRDTTERPEVVESGSGGLVGCDEARVYSEMRRLLEDGAAYAAMSRISYIYGDGFASRRIADIIENF